MIVPGEAFFIQQSPNQAHTRRDETQHTGHLTQHALIAAGSAAIEIYESKASKTHAGSIAVRQTPQRPIEDYDRGDNTEETCDSQAIQH